MGRFVGHYGTVCWALWDGLLGIGSSAVPEIFAAQECLDEICRDDQVLELLIRLLMKDTFVVHRKVGQRHKIIILDLSVLKRQHVNDAQLKRFIFHPW
jgi:hypothetical protein